MNVVVEAGAAVDIAESEVWYEARQDGLGLRFATAAMAAIRSLPPKKHRAIHGAPGHFCIAVGGFPFRVVYVMRGDSVFVVAIAHDRRDVGYWVGR